jgi:hypothetical protein
MAVQFVIPREIGNQVLQRLSQIMKHMGLALNASHKYYSLLFILTLIFKIKATSLLDLRQRCIYKGTVLSSAYPYSARIHHQ